MTRDRIRNLVGAVGAAIGLVFAVIEIVQIEQHEADVMGRYQWPGIMALSDFGLLIIFYAVPGLIAGLLLGCVLARIVRVPPN